MNKPLFDVNSDLLLGTVFEVTGTQLKLTIDRDIAELTRLHAGRVYAVGQIGSLLKIHNGRKLIFATVSLLRLQTDEELAALSSQKTNMDSQASEKRVIEANLLGEANWNRAQSKLEFNRGISNYPLPLQHCYLVTNDESTAIYESAEGKSFENAGKFVPIGTYVGSANVNCKANIDKLFGQHCAVLGSTGSGKSATVASILHSILDHQITDGQSLKPNIVLIDPHGEYSHSFTNRAKIMQAYSNITDDDENQTAVIQLPYWLMNSQELVTLIVGRSEHAAVNQANVVHNALVHARLVFLGLAKSVNEIVAALATYTVDQNPKEPQPKREEDSDAIAAFDRDLPIPFDFEEFVSYISEIAVLKWNKTKWEKDATVTGELKTIKPLLEKISLLKRDARINFLIANAVEDTTEIREGFFKLPQILEQFISSEGNPTGLSIVDISGLPSEIAGLLTGAIARLLFNYKVSQTREERERDPVLLVCEEAHRYVPNRGEAQYVVAQDAIRRLAREGRKYGLGLMLVSQRPSDIEGTVISQCNSWIVLRLTNSSDQEHVRKYLPDSLSGMVSLLSTLPRQEALFVGEAAAIPSRIKISTLDIDRLPNSNDISFVEGWSGENAENTIAEVSARMQEI